MSKAFVKTVCAVLVAIANLAGCTLPLSQLEMPRAPAAEPDPLISPPPSLVGLNQTN